MKKSIIIIAAALAIASCQENDIKNDLRESTQNAPLTFNAYSNKSTKADPTQSDLNFFYNKFNVYGWKKVNNSWVTDNPVFNNVTNQYFEEDGKGDIYTGTETVADEWSTIQGSSAFPGWYYKGIRYWDKFATEYQFCAYAPIAASSEVECTPQGVITIGKAAAPITVESTNLMSTPATALAYKTFDKDYMTATSKANYSTTANNEAVSLVFTHELAKFNIKLVLDKVNVTTNQAVIVREVSLHKLEGTSYYDSSKESETGFITGWHTPTTELAYTLKNGDNGYQLNGDIDSEKTGDQNYDGYYIMERLMVPQTAFKAVDDQSNAINAQASAYENEEYVYVKYTIGTEPYEGYYALANLFLGNTNGSSYDFLGGNEYTLTITVGPRPIYFDASVTPWVDNDANKTNIAAN